MKTKGQNDVIRIFEGISDETLGDTALFALHIDDKHDDYTIFIKGQNVDARVTAFFATAVHFIANGKDSEGIERVARMITNAFAALLENGDTTSMKIALALQESINKGMDKFLYGKEDTTARDILDMDVN